jgi:hypothetical protein
MGHVYVHFCLQTHYLFILLLPVTPQVFTVAINVQSTALHLVITVNLWKGDLVLFEFEFKLSFYLISNQVKGSMCGNFKFHHTPKSI